MVLFTGVHRIINFVCPLLTETGVTNSSQLLVCFSPLLLEDLDQSALIYTVHPKLVQPTANTKTAVIHRSMFTLDLK